MLAYTLSAGWEQGSRAEGCLFSLSKTTLSARILTPSASLVLPLETLV
jgi:hypothetical protein